MNIACVQAKCLYPLGKMNRAPDHLHFAYAKLTEYVFCHIRNGQVKDPRQLHDLADAMHNVSGILADYGAWVDDSKYRELYLRHYDQMWGHLGPKLEKLLDFFIAIHLQSSPSAPASDLAK